MRKVKVTLTAMIPAPEGFTLKLLEEVSHLAVIATINKLGLDAEDVKVLSVEEAEEWPAEIS